MYSTHSWRLTCSRCKVAWKLELAGSGAGMSIFTSQLEAPTPKDLGAALAQLAHAFGWVGGETKPLCHRCR